MIVERYASMFGVGHDNDGVLGAAEACTRLPYAAALS